MHHQQSGGIEAHPGKPGCIEAAAAPAPQHVPAPPGEAGQEDGSERGGSSARIGCQDLVQAAARQAAPGQGAVNRGEAERHRRPGGCALAARLPGSQLSLQGGDRKRGRRTGGQGRGHRRGLYVHVMFDFSRRAGPVKPLSAKPFAAEAVESNFRGLAQDDVGEDASRPTGHGPAQRAVAGVEEQTRERRCAYHRHAVRR